MYALNNLPTNVLISSDEVVYCLSSNSFSPSKINSAIQIAEQQFVIPVIGYNFYQQLISQKNVVVTSGNATSLQATFTALYGDTRPPLKLGQIVNAIELSTVYAENALLWNTILWKFVYECVYFVMLTDNYAEFNASGILKNNPAPAFLDSSAAGTSAGIGLHDLKYLRDASLFGRINPMQDALEKFLCINYAQYPLYPNPDKWDRHGNKTTTRKGSFINIYADDDDCCNDNRRAVVPQPITSQVVRTLSCTLVLNIVTTPDPDATYLLCNLNTIPLQYPAGTTITIPHLIGKVVSPSVLIDLTPAYVPTNQNTGVLDNTAGGGFLAGSTIIITYSEVI